MESGAKVESLVLDNKKDMQSIVTDERQTISVQMLAAQ